MSIRCPAPLAAGGRIGVTAPSAGVPDDLRPRLEVSIEHLRRRGFEVVVGECIGPGPVSASATDRAAELTAMLVDPTIAAVVPPWGGDLAVELLPHLDLAALAAAEPTWVVGYSDIATLLVALTTATGMATLHGPNLMETPYRVPEPLLHWLDVATSPAGSTLVQGESSAHRSSGLDRWQDDPHVTEPTLDAPGRWALLDAERTDQPLVVSGRLIGGCIETASVLAGTPYGDVRAFADEHAPEGLLVYVEACEDGALSIARQLWSMRLAGWFDRANGVLVGRTNAPPSGGFTQLDAVRSALGDLGVPVVVDVDCGHVPPQLSLVNGALAELTVSRSQARLVQHLP